MNHSIYRLLVALLLVTSGVSAQKGSVRGRVFNATTNEPIEFCTVVIEGTTIGSTSDLDGNFIFTGIEPGFVRVKATILGYQPAISAEVQVRGNQIVYVDIPMQESVKELQEVTVTNRTSLELKKLDSPLSLNTIGVQELEKTAGVNRDVSKVVQTLPGVGATSPQRNDLIVRGGGPSENVFYLDGVEIPVINHFATQGSSGGVVGIVNANFVREINFYTGAYPANRGNALSSVMDIKLRDGRKDKFHLDAALGASDAGLTVEGPMGKQSTYIASVRQSYLQYLFKAIGLPFLPTYTDFQYKQRIQLNQRNELTLIGIGAIDDMVLNLNLNNPTESQRYLLAYLPVYKQWNYTIGAVYKHYADTHFDTWVLSRNMLRNSNYKHQDNDETKAKTQDYLSDEAENKLRFERVYPDLPVRVMVGAGVKLARYTNETYRKILINGVPTDLNYNSDLNLFAYQVFGQVSDSYLDDLLNLSFGISMAGNGYNNRMANPLNQLSPRLSASYILNEQWKLNASVGRFVMQPSYTSLGYRNSTDVLVNQNEQVAYTGSNQVVAGVEVEPMDKTKFTLEGFYKSYDHYAMSVAEGISLASKGTDYGQVGDEEITSTGNGRTYGVELLMKVMELKGINLTATYTWFRSEFTDATGVFRPSSWDTRHLLNLLGSLKFGKNWTLAARWRWVGGAPYTPIDMALSTKKDVWDISNRPILDYSRYNDLRLKNSNVLDLRLDKEFYFEKWMLGVYVDVQNVTSFKSESAPIYTNLDATGTPILNSNDPTRYELRSVSNLGGTILPTLGLMVNF